MDHFKAKYSDEQRAAIEYAGCERRMRPVAIQKMAAKGELPPPTANGSHLANPLPAFEIPWSTVRSIIQAGDRRRAGTRIRQELANMQPRDRAHALERRLVALIDQDLTRMERLQAKDAQKPLNADQAAKLANAIDKLLRIGEPDKRHTKRDVTATQIGNDPATTELAGKLLDASSRNAPATNGSISGQLTVEEVLADDSGDGPRDGNDDARDEQDEALCLPQRVRPDGLIADDLSVTAV